MKKNIENLQFEIMILIQILAGKCIYFMRNPLIKSLAK